MEQLFTGQTANGSSASYNSGDTDKPVLAVVEGTWDTATMTLEISPDGGTTWVTTGQTLTANGVMTFNAPNCLPYRLTLSSVGAGTNLDAWITG